MSHRLRNFLLLAAIGLVGTLLLAWSLHEWHEEIAKDWLAGLDEELLGFAYRNHSPALTTAALGLAVLGGWWGMAGLVAAGAVWMALRGSHREAVTFGVAVLGAGLLNASLKLWFGRPRPAVDWVLADEKFYSFPSGHAATAFVFFGILAFFGVRHLGRRWTSVAVVALAVILVLAMGMSRVYLGVHYPSDIVAGYLTGAAWLSMVLVAGWQLRRRPREPREWIDEGEPVTEASG